MKALRMWRYWAEGAIVVIAVTAVMAAPWIVAATADDPAEYLLVGFLGFMGGFALAVGTVALDWTVRDYRRAARR